MPEEALRSNAVSRLDRPLVGTMAESRETVRVHSISIPAGEFTGDFYFTAEIDGVFWFAIGDVAGKGLGASLLMIQLEEELERAIRECRASTPAGLVACVHETMHREMPSNRFVSLVVGRIGPARRLTLVNAGHCAPFLLRQASSTFRNPDHAVSINSTGPVVGILEFPKWREQSFRLRSGDRLVLYTDGLSESRSADGSELGLNGIRDLLRASDRNAILEGLLAAADHHSEGSQHDDLTIVVVEIN